jgi:hypothetical protein
VIYNPNTGVLSFDADGVGKIASVPVALIGAHLNVVNTDFVVI